MTVVEAAQRLEISTALAYRLCAAGKLPHIRIGMGQGTIRISEDQLAEFIRRSTVDGPPEKIVAPVVSKPRPVIRDYLGEYRAKTRGEPPMPIIRDRLGELDAAQATKAKAREEAKAKIDGQARR